MFFLGDSAGAFLTIYATAIIHNPKLAEEFGIQTDLSGLFIKGLGLISGLFYTASKDRYGLFYKAMLYGSDMKNAMMRKYRNPESKEIMDSLPPCIFITSEGDSLKKQSITFCKVLQKMEFMSFSRIIWIRNWFMTFQSFRGIERKPEMLSEKSAASSGTVLRIIPWTWSNKAY